MKKSAALYLCFLVAITCLAQTNEGSFVRPSGTAEVRQKIAEAQKVFGSDPKEGIAKMKEVIAYCTEVEDDSIDFFVANYNLAILYYQVPDMDSALYVFRKCLAFAKEKNNHFYFYKSYLGFNRVNTYLGFYDSARYYTEKGLKHSLAMDYKKGIANNYNQLGVIAGNQGDYEKSIYYKEKSLELAEQIQDSMSIFYSAYNLAIHFQAGKLYQKSLEYSIYVQDVARGTGNNFYISLANSVTCQIYMELGDYEKALHYVKIANEAQLKAIENAEGEAHVEWLAFNNLNTGTIYNFMDSTAVARKYIKKAMLYYDSTERLESRTAAYATYADGYRQDGEYDSALYYAKIARKLGDDSGHVLEKLTGNICLAKTYQALENKDSARYYANISLKIAQVDGYYARLEEAAEILFQLSDQEGDSDDALDYLKKLTAARDTLANEERVKSATRLSMQFEFDNEKRQLAFEKEKETLLLNQQIDRQKAIQYGAFGGILLLSIVFYGYYRNYQNKQKDHLKIVEQAIELRQKNEQLNELSRYKEGLSHMIVHDMKNPLNVILGLSGEKIPDAEKSQLINEAAKLILQLAHDIIDIQKFEEAKMQMEYEVYEIKEVIQHAEDQVDLMMKVKNMSFSNHFSEKLKASIDLRLMSRILVNLFTNAIKYSPAGSTLEVDLRERSGGFYELAVSDSGQGIPEDQLPHIFDKFWQVYAKKSGNTYSSGLGLTFCRLAVEAHGGSIEVTSIVGKGSTFTLILPIGEVNMQQAEIVKKLTEEVDADEAFYNEKEQKILGTVIRKIVDIPIYKAGVIEKILDDVDSDSEKVNEWIQMIKFAILSWDQQRFEELLRIGDDSIPKTGTDD